MVMAVIWLCLAVVFAIGEGLTLALTSIWFAISAAIMCFVSFTGMGIWGQIALFLTMSIIFMFIARPIVKNKFNSKLEETNTKIGKEGIVVQAKPLRVKIQDVDFTATSEEELVEGDTVIVTDVQGVTLAVKKG